MQGKEIIASLFDEAQFVIFKELLPYWAGFMKTYKPPEDPNKRASKLPVYITTAISIYYQCLYYSNYYYIILSVFILFHLLLYYIISLYITPTIITALYSR